MANLPLLLQLQTIDSRIQVLNRLKEETQQHQNLAALQLLLDKLEKQRDLQTAQQAEIRSVLRRLELELKSCQDRLRAEDQKLYGGTIQNSRELAQIEQKSSELRHHQAELEEQVLIRMETDERLTQEQEACQKRIVAAEQEAGEYRKEIEHRLLEIALEVETLKQDRRDLEPQIPPDWLERYRKIAKAHHGLAIAKMKGSRCGGCHVEVSESFLQKAKRGDDALVYCENCGRILFF